MATTDERQMRALRIIAGGATRLTEHGNTIVSRECPALLRAGLIRYARNRRIGYRPTAAGLALIDRMGKRMPDGDWPQDAGKDVGGNDCDDCGCVFIGVEGRSRCRQCTDDLRAVSSSGEAAK